MYYIRPPVHLPDEAELRTKQAHRAAARTRTDDDVMIFDRMSEGRWLYLTIPPPYIPHASSVARSSRGK